MNDTTDTTKNVGCMYFDYTDMSLEEWHNHLVNSETTEYKFLGNDTAINGTFLKKYTDGCVATWDLRLL